MSAVMPAPDEGSWPAIESTTGRYDLLCCMSKTEFVSGDNSKGHCGKHNIALEFFAAQNIRDFCDKLAVSGMRGTCAQFRLLQH
jgi:hypothetical protein